MERKIDRNYVATALQILAVFALKRLEMRENKMQFFSIALGAFAGIDLGPMCCAFESVNVGNCNLLYMHEDEISSPFMFAFTYETCATIIYDKVNPITPPI